MSTSPAAGTGGKFITLEGIDGAGKSTHLQWLRERLEFQGKTVVMTREPGGTPLGEKLRDMLLHEAMHPETETLLMFAARREHLQQVIRPALARGEWVVSDRFTDATFAYQGGGKGVSPAKLEALESWVQDHLQPDLTLLFDVSEAMARERVSRAGRADKFEREEAEFFRRVRAAYLARATAAPERVRIVDSGRSIPDIQKSLEEIISSFCK